MIRNTFLGLPMLEAEKYVEFGLNLKKAADLDTEIAEAAEDLERLVRVVLQRQRVDQLEEELEKERAALNSLGWAKRLHD